MSEVISLSTFHNHNLTDQDHALFMQTVTSQSGLFYGCEVTLKDENTLHISTGEGIACGRIFRIMDMDYPVELSASGDLLGRLYVHIDTALDDTPAQLMDVQGSTLPALIQEDDMNQSTGVYEIELATFSINELGISNLEFTAPKATGGGAGGKSIAPDYSATESYEKGRIFFQNGTLYKTIAAIPAGAPLVLDTNVVETSLAAEIEALNLNLTWRYNALTDMEQAYYNGQWVDVRKAFLQTLIYFNSSRGYNSSDFGQIVKQWSKSSSFGDGNGGCDDTINNNNIVYYVTATPSTTNKMYAYGSFTSSEFVDLTRYSKVHVSGVATYTHNLARDYGRGAAYFIIVNENGVETTIGYTAELTPSVPTFNLDQDFDLTQYSGNYKFMIKLEASGWYQNFVTTTNLTVNELYFQ